MFPYLHHLQRQEQGVQHIYKDLKNVQVFSQKCKDSPPSVADCRHVLFCNGADDLWTGQPAGLKGGGQWALS